MSIEIKRFSVNGVEFEFVNEYWETRNNWGHKTYLFRNGQEIANNKVRYYNRTWECYRYQTCMKGCVGNVISDTLDRALENYKEEHKINRFSKGQKDIVIDELKKNYKPLVDLYSLYEMI